MAANPIRAERLGRALDCGSDLLVVSHACAREVNQAVYLEMSTQGCSLRLVVPKVWADSYSHGSFEPTPLAGMESLVERLPVVGAGRPQRHLWIANALGMLRGTRPAFLLVEEEPLALSALQWSTAAMRLGIPFGLQVAENRDRRLPHVVTRYRRYLLRHASFVMARSPAAALRAREWGALGEVAVVPHAVPQWVRAEGVTDRPFTVGYAGRLVEEKGLWDLVESVRSHPEWRLVLVGDGPLRTALSSVGPRVCVRSDFTHAAMPSALALMDVLVLPSRTTPTWSEQFGRVLVEALSCRVPVVGSSSGEIPWVIESTGGGLVFPEGDIHHLTGALERLAQDRRLRERLATAGVQAVAETFAVPAVARQLRGLVARFSRRGVADPSSALF